MHAPSLHIPRPGPPPPPHESPSTMQVLSMQQPPALQASPLQQGSPSSPQCSHIPPPKPPLHSRSGLVQKNGSGPGREIVQHASPSPPQVNIGLVQWPSMHVVTVPHIV